MSTGTVSKNAIVLAAIPHQQQGDGGAAPLARCNIHVMSELMICTGYRHSRDGEGLCLS